MDLAAATTSCKVFCAIESSAGIAGSSDGAITDGDGDGATVAAIVTGGGTVL
jgi:hypothetical protein